MTPQLKQAIDRQAAELIKQTVRIAELEARIEELTSQNHRLLNENGQFNRRIKELEPEPEPDACVEAFFKAVPNGTYADLELWRTAWAKAKENLI